MSDEIYNLRGHQIVIYKFLYYEIVYEISSGTAERILTHRISENKK